MAEHLGLTSWRDFFRAFAAALGAMAVITLLSGGRWRDMLALWVGFTLIMAGGRLLLGQRSWSAAPIAASASLMVLGGTVTIVGEEGPITSGDLVGPIGAGLGVVVALVLAKRYQREGADRPGVGWRGNLFDGWGAASGATESPKGDPFDASAVQILFPTG